jgi:predicted MPP superfamily phosphohydrolase
MERVASAPTLSLYQRIRALILKVWCEVCLTLTGQKEKAKKCAQSMQFREESCDFLGLPDTLQGVKLLFLTDAHIGGNIDTVAAEISTHIHVLLGDARPKKTLVLHGGDFVCSEVEEAEFLEVSTKLFHGLSRYSQFGVIGNHDHANPQFTQIRRHLEDIHALKLLETPDHVQHVEIDGATLSIHGIHTLSDALHIMNKNDRNTLMDTYIDSLNAERTDCNIVLLHNPDGLEFLIQRLTETSQSLHKPTLFLAGHTHGAMLDVPLLRHIGLMGCKTHYGRYKGWYWPDKQNHTGNWKLYVSTGMGNSRGLEYRVNAQPEVLMFTL